jgi:hypothetical protein
MFLIVGLIFYFDDFSKGLHGVTITIHLTKILWIILIVLIFVLLPYFWTASEFSIEYGDEKLPEIHRNEL